MKRRCQQREREKEDLEGKKKKGERNGERKGKRKRERENKTRNDTAMGREDLIVFKTRTS